MENIINNLIVELRRGTQILFVLDSLKVEQYGYSLLQDLSNKGLSIEAGTLYPLLRRLDEQGLLDSNWDTTESRPRKFYKLNDTGYDILNTLKNEWLKLNKEMSVLFTDYEEKK